ncbi:polyketide cyclase [Penicillium digitatum]|uniref:Uncharacterized protein n=3 Tax=Penicillium digitatum TaxID=36651 RepID=K9G3E4_PEND2|nr:hypothetical protein PDIP_61300 [Penicillium digitatum Pd1]EKV10210.1 hypothetical protein PDIP_61300 [Penicillium digitatum Pd1]EKV15382.1 hypothetical protein PDIG_26850 [Penicillium digitatum PHI26]KAG0157360.1 hypothetical protein PDIDSM_4545 [Penicillium digitatum]QQK44312.1 polyketide cyclase [Penicillium digitatum]
MGTWTDLASSLSHPSDLLDGFPPPYTELDPQTATQAPQLDTPSYTESTSTSATTKFPPAINGYFQWKFTTTFHLGPTADEKLFAVSTPATVFKNKPTILLYDGPTNKHPVMATAQGDKWGRSRPIAITLLPRPGSQHEDAIVEQVIPGGSLLHASPSYTFETSVGPKGTTREKFEWRKSYGNEFKELAGLSYGWKLARLTGPVNSVGGSKKERDRGYTSDGLEIVALIAHNASWSLTKGFRFIFMGAGLTGTMGEIWEIVVVTSALQLWVMDVQDTSAATPTVASAAIS